MVKENLNRQRLVSFIESIPDKELKGQCEIFLESQIETLLEKITPYDSYLAALENFILLPSDEFSPVIDNNRFILQQGCIPRYIFRGQNVSCTPTPSAMRTNRTPLDRYRNTLSKYFLNYLMNKALVNTGFEEKTKYKAILPEEYLESTLFDKKLFELPISWEREIVAQHYLLDTDFLDITTDLAVALFFAYTYYDKKGDSFQPLLEFYDAESKTEYSPSLFYKDGLEFSFVSHGMFFPKDQHPLITSSYHIFPRPLLQSALALDFTKTTEPVETYFNSMQLPKNPDISTWIYNHFHKGKDLWPHSNIATVVKEIKNAVINYTNTTKGLIDEAPNKVIKILCKIRKNLDYQRLIDLLSQDLNEAADNLKNNISASCKFVLQGSTASHPVSHPVKLLDEQSMHSLIIGLWNAYHLNHACKAEITLRQASRYTVISIPKLPDLLQKVNQMKDNG